MESFENTTLNDRKNELFTENGTLYCYCYFLSFLKKFTDMEKNFLPCRIAENLHFSSCFFENTGVNYPYEHRKNIGTFLEAEK